MVVWLKPHVVFEVVVIVVTNSYVLIMYVHLVHHHDEPPSMYDNHISHLIHHVMHAIIVFELLLPIVVIYFSLTSSIVATFSFVALVMNCFPFVFKRNMVCTTNILGTITLNGFILPFMIF